MAEHELIVAKDSKSRTAGGEIMLTNHMKRLAWSFVSNLNDAIANGSSCSLAKGNSGGCG